MLNPTATGSIVFACAFGGALLGWLLRTILPKHHVDTDSKDIIKLGMGLIGTMAALVLGLLIASAQSSYNAQKSELTQMSAKLVLLDIVLANYGPQAQQTRELLQRSVARLIEQTWPQNDSHPAQLDPAASSAEPLYRNLLQLSPQNETQNSLKAQALAMAADLGQMRWLLFEQMGSSISAPFLVVVVFWLTIIFVSFGLFAPPNATVVATLCVCALSVSFAIFLILELDRPFAGFIQISDAPLRSALGHLGH
jgi:membrane-bound ClpP family serine protease